MAHAVRDVTGTRPRNRKWNLISYQATTRLTPLFYVAPATLLFCLLMLYPMVMVIRYSLMDGAIVKKTAGFAGLQNYRAVFADPVFWESVGNTLYFTVMSVIFHLLIGLAFALLLNSPRLNQVLRSVLRVLFILPWLFTAVIIAIIWRLLLDPNGVINNVLMTLHIVGFKVEWFSSPRTALHAVTFVNIWAGYPLYMVSLLAGLQGIPKELYEAADIDGANAWEKLRHITIPQLMPIMISIALLDFIWTMQVFPLVWMTTGGGPIHATEMLSTYTYKLAFREYDFSLASASAVLILLLSMSMTYFYIKHQKAR
jgi:multiple sugar transport system permease protein